MLFPLPWYTIFFISFPQTIIAIKLGMALFNMQISTRNLLLAATPSSLVAYYIHMMPVAFGVHTVIVLITTGLLITVVNKNRIAHSLLSCMVGIMIFGVLEIVALYFLSFYCSDVVTYLSAHPWFIIVFYQPILLVALLLYLLVRRRHIVVFDVSAGSYPRIFPCQKG